MGANPQPETGLSYISAVDCGTPDPVPVGDIGFPNMHWIFNVNGSCPSGSPNANRNSHRDAKAHSIAEAAPDTGSASVTPSPSATVTPTATASVTASATATAARVLR